MEVYHSAFVGRTPDKETEFISHQLFIKVRCVQTGWISQDRPSIDECTECVCYFTAEFFPVEMDRLPETGIARVSLSLNPFGGADKLRLRSRVCRS